MENSSKTNITNTLEDDNIVELIELLEEIDETNALAKANAVSFVGKDGRRILF